MNYILKDNRISGSIETQVMGAHRYVFPPPHHFPQTQILQAAHHPCASICSSWNVPSQFLTLIQSHADTRRTHSFREGKVWGSQKQNSGSPNCIQVRLLRIINWRFNGWNGKINLLGNRKLKLTPLPRSMSSKKTMPQRCWQLLIWSTGEDCLQAWQKWS